MADSGKFIVQNFGSNPAVNFNFMLRVEGFFDLPCKSVRAFQRENEYELIQEGGVNDYVHMRRKPVSKPFTFQVERYVGTDDLLDPLGLGTDLILPVVLYVTRYRAYGNFDPVRLYTFTGCTVMSKEYGELNAEKSGLLVETTTIAYREMLHIEAMEQIVDRTGITKMEPWKFDGTKMEGQGPKYAVRNTTEERKADMEAKAARWPEKRSAVDVAAFLSRR